MYSYKNKEVFSSTFKIYKVQENDDSGEKTFKEQKLILEDKNAPILLVEKCDIPPEYNLDIVDCKLD